MQQRCAVRRRGMAGKGGSRLPPVSRNVPGMANSSIAGLPLRGVAVFRDEQEKALDWCEQLRVALDQYAPGEVSFENIDVSMVQWSSLDFSLLVDVLSERYVSTRRLKAYKCGLDDECIGQVTAWLSGLPAQSLPSEIHLSHNSMTQEGFLALLEVIEQKRSELTEKVPPIWLRVEENQVPQEVIDQLVAEGKIGLAQSVSARQRLHCEALVAMPSLRGGDRRASPTAAGLAVWNAPGKGGKGVNFSAKGAVAGGKGVQSGKGSLSLPSSKGGGQLSSGAPWAERGTASVTGAIRSGWRGDSRGPSASGGASSSATTPPPARPLGCAGKGLGKSGKVPLATQEDHLLDLQLERELTRDLHQQQQAEFRRTQQQRQQPQQARASAVPAKVAGKVAAARDRSRTPAVRNKASNPQDDADKPLPHPWEKHWSDEYNIPYFWNKETGESLWETPTF